MDHQPPDRLTFTVYYDDGSTYSGPPEDAPGLGVVVVLQDDAFTMVGHDFYCWHADQLRWWGADQAGLWDYLHRPGWKRVLFGRTVSNQRYGEIHGRAMRDAGMIT